MIFRSKKTQNLLKEPDLNPYNAGHFFDIPFDPSLPEQCERNSKERSLKQYYFSNRLSRFTGDQSNHGCLQVGAQGKIVFTRRVSSLFSIGDTDFEKVRTYLEHRKHSDNG